MMNKSRIPEYRNKDIKGMYAWFDAMTEAGLLFHPDDPADSIIRIATNEAVFSTEECFVVDAIIGEMFAQFGDEVYEAAYQSSMALWPPNN